MPDLTGETYKARSERPDMLVTAVSDTALLATQEQGVGDVTKISTKSDFMYPETANTNPVKKSSEMIVYEAGKVLKRDKVEEIIATPLDNVGSDTYNAVTMNPNRAKAVLSNAEGTKAYSADLDRLLNDNYARGIYYRDKVFGTMLELIKTTEFDKIKNGSFSLNIALKNTTSIYGASYLYLTSSSGTATRITATQDSETGNVSFVITDDSGATVFNYAMSNEIRISTKMLTLNFSKPGSTTIFSLYSNNVLLYTASSSATITFSGQNNVTLNAGILVDTLFRYNFFNYALTASEVSILWNNGRPDKCILPEYMKWVNNTDINAGYNFTSGWLASGTSTINTATKFTTTTGGSIYKSNVFPDKIANFMLKIKVKNQSGEITFRSANNPTNPINVPTNIDFTEYNLIYYGRTRGSNRSLEIATTFAQSVEFEKFEIIQLGAVSDYSSKGMVQSGTVSATETRVINAGTAYEIFASNGAYNFVALGALDNNINTRFVATQTVNTGADANRVKPVVVTQWLDNSTNANNATVTGNPAMVSVPVEEKQGQGIINDVMQRIPVSASANKILGTVPAGWRVDDISLETVTAPSANVMLSVGIGTKQKEIVNAFTHDRTFVGNTLQPVLRKYFNPVASQDIYISSTDTATPTPADGWLGGVYNFIITLRRV